LWSTWKEDEEGERAVKLDAEQVTAMVAGAIDDPEAGVAKNPAKLQSHWYSSSASSASTSAMSAICEHCVVTTRG